MKTIDPNLFRVDFPQMTEVIIMIVILSFLVERALSVIFESRIFIEKTEDGEIIESMRKKSDLPIDDTMRKRKKKRGLKEFIAFIVSVAICFIWNFDALSIIMKSDTMSYFGYIITGGVIAGGSKGSIVIFKQWLGIMSSAEEARIAAKQLVK